MSRPVIAVSLGDPNGIGPEILLRAHTSVSRICRPLYCAHPSLLEEAARRLDIALPPDLAVAAPDYPPCPIRPGRIDADAGAYSYASFQKAIALCRDGEAAALVTLPVHKEAWAGAGIAYRGHTEVLRAEFGKDAIMMLGCEKLFVGLFSEHIPLREVPDAIEREKLVRFLLDFWRETGAERIGVLGLNPHAGDGGVLGNEERIIEAAIAEADAGRGIFEGPLVPDAAFTPRMRRRYGYYVAMYHDQGLAPLKALYFDESINVSLNLPVIRTSVDHGTAFDIAYRRRDPSTESYLEAVRYALKRAQRKIC